MAKIVVIDLGLGVSAQSLVDLQNAVGVLVEKLVVFFFPDLTVEFVLVEGVSAPAQLLLLLEKRFVCLVFQFTLVVERSAQPLGDVLDEFIIVLEAAKHLPELPLQRLFLHWSLGAAGSEFRAAIIDVFALLFFGRYHPAALPADEKVLEDERNGIVAAYTALSLASTAFQHVLDLLPEVEGD